MSFLSIFRRPESSPFSSDCRSLGHLRTGIACEVCNACIRNPVGSYLRDSSLFNRETFFLIYRIPFGIGILLYPLVATHHHRHPFTAAERLLSLEEFAAAAASWFGGGAVIVCWLLHGYDNHGEYLQSVDHHLLCPTFARCIFSAVVAVEECVNIFAWMQLLGDLLSH